MRDQVFQRILGKSKFAVTGITQTEFFKKSNEPNERFMLADLSRSGLTPAHMQTYTDSMMRLREGASSGYGIPYFHLDGRAITDIAGNLVMYRVRLEYPEYHKGQRYDQPTNDVLQKYGLPGSIPYLNPALLEPEYASETVLCCEGEKKSVAAMRFLSLPAFGIGGCWNWRSPVGPGVHPWILKLLAERGYKRVVIVPDGDLYRYDICNAYGTFAHELRQSGVDVSVVVPSGKIDDLVVGWGSEARAKFDELPTIDPNELVQSQKSLIDRYNLSFKVDAKERPIPHQHTSNVTKLLTQHPAFPKIWRNLDDARIMVGDETAVPDSTEMRIANYFQHNLGFERVNHKTIRDCVLSIARDNSRSPFLDYVRAQSWDGVARLDTTFIRNWSVADTPFHREVSAKWLISACARMHKPGTKIDWMLITIGPQGTGKTSMPSILFGAAARTIYGEQSDKDLHLLLHSGLCIGFDELDSFGRRESSNLKAMITRNEDAFRPPYGASIEVFPRRFTLYGCGNRYEFLQHDPSGYRRYAIIEVAKLLDFRGLAAERDQLWAEAWQRYETDAGKYWEVENASAHAESFVVVNPLVESIERLLADWRKRRPEAMLHMGAVKFTTGDVLTGLGVDPVKSPSTSVVREVGSILRVLVGAPSGTTTGPGMRKSKWYTLT